MITKLLRKLTSYLLIILLFAGNLEKQRSNLTTVEADAITSVIWSDLFVKCEKRNRVSQPSAKYSFYLILIILLANDVQLNPGPFTQPWKNSKAHNLSPTRLVGNQEIDGPTNQNGFEQLPQITSEEYLEGKDYCPVCGKPVHKNHRAVSCDSCLFWNHLKCSDMKLAEYMENKNKESFSWICTKCRHQEPTPNTKCSSSKSARVPLKNICGRKGGLIMHLNCRSINGKLDDVNDILDRAKPDMLVLTETWLDSSHHKGYLNFKGYKHLRKDRPQEVKQKYKKVGGGGVAVLYRSNLVVTTLTDLNRKDDEVFWIRTKIRNKNYVIGTVYRPEYSDLLEGECCSMEKHIQNALQRSPNVIILGDLNVDLLQPSCEKGITNKAKLEKIFQTYGMSQKVEGPTRTTNQTETLIDHIWVTNSCCVDEAGSTDGISDHHGTFLQMKVPLEQVEKKIKVRNFKNYQKEKLTENYVKEMRNSAFNDLVQNDKVNEATELWVNTVASLTDIEAPEKEINLKSKTEAVPWFHDGIRKLLDTKAQMLQKYKRKGDKYTKHLLQNITKKLKNMKRSAKRNYYREKIEEQSNDPRRLWSILKEVSRTESVNEEIMPDNVDQKTVDSFNQYFATIGKNIQEELGTKTNYAPGPIEGFMFKEESPESVKKLIGRLKQRVATGHDRIPSRILKDLSEVASEDLAKLINLSYRTKIFPSILKQAKITAIYKNKGNQNSPEYYRPISVLSVLSKVFERSATDQLVAYFESNNKLYTSQHAYRRRHSTTTCLIEAMDHIYENLDKGNLVCLVSTDLSKAFDTLSHGILLEKLQRAGLGRHSVDLGAILSNRAKATSKDGKCYLVNLHCRGWRPSGFHPWTPAFHHLYNRPR